MANVIVGLVILSILSLSIRKIIIEKRKGVHCVGCPSDAGCSSKKKQDCAPVTNIELKK